MDEVIPNLWISSREAASDSKAISDANILSVISLGCNPVHPQAYSYLSFPDLLDTPETFIIHLLPEAVSFIHERIKHGSVLVHCVYGQSRSVTVIIAYLLDLGYQLVDAFRCLKLKHDGISVNPGFLSQLHLYSMRSKCWAEYSLALLSREKHKFYQYFHIYESIPKHDICLKLIRCKKCHQTLASSQFLLERREGYEEFFDEFVDDFWRHYRCSYSSKKVVKFPTSEYYIITPPKWLMLSCKAKIEDLSNSILTAKKRKMCSLDMSDSDCRNVVVGERLGDEHNRHEREQGGGETQRLDIINVDIGESEEVSVTIGMAAASQASSLAEVNGNTTNTTSCACYRDSTSVDNNPNTTASAGAVIPACLDTSYFYASEYCHARYPMHCPHSACSAVIGYWQLEGLQICSFAHTHLFALSKENTYEF